MAVINSTDRIVVVFEYCCLSRMESSIGRLLGWKQSVQIGMTSEVLGKETFHEFGGK